MNGTWVDLAAGSAIESDHSAVYDPVRDRLVLFGGRGNADANDVWEMSLSGSTRWDALAPVGAPPSGRKYHSAVYDPVRDRMLIFGGSRNDGSGCLNDVWSLTLSGVPEWVQLAPAGAPPGARLSHGAVYDPVRDRMLVFGGHCGGSYYDDVWALSLSGIPTWTRLTPEGTPPGGRAGFASAYDSARDRVLVFGGYDGATFFSETWVLSLGGEAAWTCLDPLDAPPEARYSAASVYDATNDRMVVFGGYDGTVYRDDSWTLSLGSQPAWTRVASADPRPPARRGHSATYDPVRGRMIVFGGFAGRGLVDAWAMSFAGAPAWTRLPSAGIPPPGRGFHSAVLDAAGERMVVYGGVQTDGLSTDVRGLPLSGEPLWAELLPTGESPADRWDHTAIYDPVRGRMVVFGGASGPAFDDLHVLSLTGVPAWSRITPVGGPPAARRGHSSVYDPVRDRMLVFGGYDNRYQYFGDVWALSLSAAPVWTPAVPAGTPPSARTGHTAVYDAVRDRMLVFGGYSETGAYLSDTWELTLAGTPCWTMLAPAGDAPAPRSGHGAIYDPVRDRMVVFGGLTGWSGAPVCSNDVWALSMSGTPVWTRLAPDGAPASERYAHTAVYDPVRDRVALFGGYTGWFYNDVRVLVWDEPLPASADCSGDVVWTPGGDTPLDYGITNPYGFAQTADYVLTSERDWPGFPVVGNVAVDAASRATVPITVAVPDTAADGMNTLTLVATLRSVPQRVSCTHHLRDATTPTRLALVNATAEPDLVRLTWHSASGTVAATVYRRAEATEWAAVGGVATDGTGQLVYEDRAVVAGTRYGYRLGVMEDGAETYAGEAWVDVPAAEFALNGARPNPAAAELSVSFSLRDASPARLEAYDLAGRRVAARDVGALGAGTHVVKLGEGARLGCGVYVVRLTRGAHMLTTRAVIVR